MAKANPRPLQLERTRLQGLFERVGIQPLDHGQAGRRQGGDGEDQLARALRELLEAPGHEVREARGQDERLAGGEARRRRNRAPDFEGVERVAARKLEHLPEGRPRQREAEPRAEEATDLGEPERLDGDPHQAVGRKGALELQRVRRTLLEPARSEERHRLRLEAPQEEREHSGGRLVEPLEVVHRDQHAGLARQREHAAVRGERERQSIDLPARGHAKQRTLERASLRGWKRREDVVEHRAEQIGQAGEGKGRLRFGALRAKDDAATRLRAGDRLAPEHGLAAARLSLEDERRRPLVEPNDEALDALELVLATDDFRQGHRGDVTVTRVGIPLFRKIAPARTVV